MFVRCNQGHNQVYVCYTVLQQQFNYLNYIVSYVIIGRLLLCPCFHCDVVLKRNYLINLRLGDFTEIDVATVAILDLYIFCTVYGIMLLHIDIYIYLHISIYKIVILNILGQEFGTLSLLNLIRMKFKVFLMCRISTLYFKLVIRMCQPREAVPRAASREKSTRHHLIEIGRLLTTLETLPNI